ncbi:uncharacterized protein [Elaeis guineensis]|uniref:uncharacterized protein isoform X2 n=1 Tax=Elaeis guineensis var. tenera TaxID=51953 RepID=UPI003C6DAB07
MASLGSGHQEESFAHLGEPLSEPSWGRQGRHLACLLLLHHLHSLLSWLFPNGEAILDGLLLFSDIRFPLQFPPPRNAVWIMASLVSRQQGAFFEEWCTTILQGTICAFPVYFQNQHWKFLCWKCIFLQSLDAAIFLFSLDSEIPMEVLLLPVISTNDRLTLGCELQDGTIICGQMKFHTQLMDVWNLSTKYTSKIELSLMGLCFNYNTSQVLYMSSEGSNLLHEELEVQIKESKSKSRSN